MNLPVPLAPLTSSVFLPPSFLPFSCKTTLHVSADESIDRIDKIEVIPCHEIVAV